jgi:hypothetical protein
VAELLHVKMDPRIPRDRWRRLMTYGWLADKPELGRVVDRDGRIAGFVGMVLSDRPVRGRCERIVDISSWYLEKELRGRGLGIGLMRSALADPDVTYCTMTPSPLRLHIFRAVGFEDLDTRRLVWRRGSDRDPLLAVERDAAALRAALDPAQRRMLDDHTGLAVTPVLARRAGADCLLVLAVARKDGGVETWDVLHASDRRFLARHGAAIAAALLPDGPAALVADSRLVDGAAAGAESEALATPRLYRSPRLAPHEIDNLYNELQLLELKLG